MSDRSLSRPAPDWIFIAGWMCVGVICALVWAVLILAGLTIAEVAGLR